MKVQSFRIGERFEIARAIHGAIRRLAWKRRLWTVLTIFGLLVSAIALTTVALSTLTALSEHLSPLVFVWSVRFVLGLSAVSLMVLASVGVHLLLRERFSKVVAAVDNAFGGEIFRNAFDLANLSEDEKFVSPYLARIAIAQAWQKWQEASQSGIANALTVMHRNRAAIALTIAFSLSLLAFAFSHAFRFSVSNLLAIYRDCQAALAFERNGELRLTVKEDGVRDGVVLKGSVVLAQVEVFCPNGALPQRLKVWSEWRNESGKTKRLQMRKIGNAVFDAEIVVSESGALQAVSGKVRSNQVRLRAEPPPRIAEWLITVEPPTYTNLPTETFTSPEWQPLTVLKGSKVTIVATSTEVLSSASCDFSHFVNSGEKAHLTFSEQTVQWSGVISAPIRMKWRFVDRFGFKGETRWLTINVRPDKPPKVTVLAGSDLVVAGGFIPLTVQAEDDFGISELGLQFGLSDDKRLPNPIHFVPLRIVPSQRVEQNLALPTSVDAAGKVLWVRAVAKDNDEVSGSKSASSKWVLIRIGEPEELLGDLEDWLARLRAWENQLQKGEWTKTQQELSKWLRRWQELMQQFQWSETPLTHQWLADWLSHWQEHLQRKDLTGALQELWQMQRALERALGEQSLAELAQRISALRAQQEALYNALRRHARPSSLAQPQKQLAEQTKDFVNDLRAEAKRWEQLDEPTVAFALNDVARVLERRPTEQAMAQAQSAMEQDLRETALLRTHEALSDLREAEELLTSPTQSPLAQLYRRERNLLARLLEQTERIRRDQELLRRETEGALPTASQQRPSEVSPQRLGVPLNPPSPPAWEEVEKLSTEGRTDLQPFQRGLAERQQQLRQRTERLQRPLSEAVRAVPQLSPDTSHKLQDAINHMSEAAESLEQGTSDLHRQKAIPHQRQAERALQQLAEDLRQALMMERGTATQRMGAGENEAMALARRQAQLLRETQRLHRQQQQGRTPSPMALEQLGAEEGAIRNALSRMEGFFGDSLPPELRQRVQRSLQNLRWLEQNLPEGRLGSESQQRQRQVLETLLQLAQSLSGQQGNQQGQQQQARQSQTPNQPDINWGRFVEHGPPMRQVPEALQGAKGGASFAEPAKSVKTTSPKPQSIPRISLPPAYREAVQKYQRQIR